MNNSKIMARWQSSLMSTYAPPKLALTRGEGSRVWDADGNSYIDMIGGLAVSSLGHAHPAIIEAVTSQVGRLAHASNLYASEPSIHLAERLLDLFGSQGDQGRVFFCNSGAEANEAAFKIARRTGRPKIIATRGAFHGRTMGALALTGQPEKRAPFEPLPGLVTHVPYGDVESLRDAMDSDTAAVIVEPILGEAGVILPPDGYLRSVRELTKNAGALMIIDEIQTGVARTGAWFGFQWEGVEPDVVTLAKGLAGGLPIGACIGFGESASLLTPGQHASTFGGNPVSCSAALAVLDVIARDGLVGHAAAAGRQMMLGIDALDHPLIRGVRGRGLFIGVGINDEKAPRIERKAALAGFLVNAIGKDTIRLAPPLVIGSEEITGFVDALPAILDMSSAL